MTRGRVGLLALELWLPIALIAAWWLLSRDSTSPFFPPLATILDRFAELWIFEQARADLVPSVRNLLAGYGIALAVGIGSGLLLGLTPPLARALSPLLEVARALPGVALLPLFFLLLSGGARMAIAVIAFGSVWPILLNTVDGIRGVDPSLHDMSRSFRLPWHRRILSVILPAAGPQILAGARTALSIAVILVVVSELIGSSEGVGRFILTAQRTFAITDMWTGMILLGIVGYLLNVAFRGVEDRVLHWHPSRRPGGARP